MAGVAGQGAWRYRPAVLAAAPIGTAAPIHSISETILVVDDDHSARRLVARVLGDAGYGVLEAPGPLRALDLTAQHAGGIHLLLTDIRMPLMSGIELAARFSDRLPSVPVLLISGYHDHGDLPHPLLPKPFTPSELVDAVAVALRPEQDGGLAAGSPR